MSGGWRIAIGACLCVMGANVAASAGDDPGVDVLILADRSRSMPPSAATRIDDALKMSARILAWSSDSARVRHRIGVISFGSEAHRDLPLVPVDRDSLPEVQRWLDGLQRRSLGHTNFPVAFAAAADAFDEQPVDTGRRHAILLLTDGRADVPGMTVDVSADRVRQVLTSRLSRSRATVDVLLLGTDRDAALWRGIASINVHRVAGDRGEFLAALHRVVGGVVGTRNEQMQIAGEGDVVVLPPYLDLVIFDVFRGAAGKDVSIHAPGSSRALHARSPGVEEMHVGDFLTMTVIRRPAPGAWLFRKVDPKARVKVLSQHFFPRGVLLQPLPHYPLRQHDRVAVQYRVLDGNGQALRELADYPLAVGVTIATPDGRRHEMPMWSRGNGVYRAAADTECAAAGRYWTEVAITTVDAAAKPIRVFEDRWSGFTVDQASRVDCRLSSRVDVFRIRAQCRDQDRRPTELQGFFQVSPLRAVLENRANRFVSTVPLQYLGGGEFEGVLPANTTPGRYAMRLELDPSRVSSAVNIRLDPERVSWERPADGRTEMIVFLLTALTAVAMAIVLRHVLSR